MALMVIGVYVFTGINERRKIISATCATEEMMSHQVTVCQFPGFNSKRKNCVFFLCAKITGLYNLKAISAHRAAPCMKEILKELIKILHSK